MYNACDSSLDISRRGTQQHSIEMSSEGENDKSLPLEGGDAKAEEEVDSPKKPATESKVEESKPEEKKEEKEKEKPEENDKKETNDTKKDEKEEKPDGNAVEKEEDGSEEAGESDKEDDKNDDGDDSEKEDKGTSKDKKKNQKEEKEKDKDKEAKTEIPEGTGTQLGEIARIDASISRFKNDDLKLLHKLLFKAPGKTALIKKNIRKFNGFDFKKDTEEYKKKLAAIEKFEVKQLKIISEMLDLERKGNKEEISERILEFLIEPKDSGRAVGGGRPKRTAAVKANNRGYSSHDDSYSSDEKHTPRARRNMGKRANLKEDTSSESEFKPSENSDEERPAVKKRKRVGRKKKEDSEEEASEVNSGSSDEDSEGGSKNKQKKVANSKVPPKGKVAPTRGRGRKPAAAPVATTPAKKKVAATPAKRGRKRAQESSEEEEESGDAPEEEGSSSEDEPLAKKTAKAPQPPTDEEIKTYVKEILEGANLEEITMKTVCKQVYAHYPNFDLTHKKDYIKTTVKSLIST